LEQKEAKEAKNEGFGVSFCLKPLEASLRDGSRGGVMVWELDLDLRFIWKLGIGNFRSGLVGGVEFPQTNFQISSKTKFQGPNEAEVEDGRSAPSGSYTLPPGLKRRSTWSRT